jgi:hypothetical protein
MRNYWLRIALGAAAVFTIGMIGVTLARQGVSRVRGVVEGSGPISLPLGFIPFRLDGEKLGTVNRVVVLRDAPKQISSVELRVKLEDSIVARGLEGCQLAAHFDEEPSSDAGEGSDRKFTPGMFTCLPAGHVPQQFQPFGRAVFQPGDVSVPLLLPDDIVDDLKEGQFGSPAEEDSAAETMADSIADAAEALADSIAAAAELRAESIVAQSERLSDSLRREGLRRADSTRRAKSAVPDSNPVR